MKVVLFIVDRSGGVLAAFQRHGFKFILGKGRDVLMLRAWCV
jgi:hypothetical protein